MDFCPKCGNIMRSVKKGEGNIVLKCRKCGTEIPYRDSHGDKASSKSAQASIVVIDKDVRTMPTLKVVCPKCQNDTAYVWQVQTRGGDEPMTQFYRCVKCGFTWRDYG